MEILKATLRWLTFFLLGIPACAISFVMMPFSPKKADQYDDGVGMTLPKMNLEFPHIWKGKFFHELKDFMVEYTRLKSQFACKMFCFLVVLGPVLVWIF